jgi:hypothetical protein
MDVAAKSLNDRYRIKKHYYGGNPPPTREDVRNVLVSGAGVIFHVGHGSDYDWQNCTSVTDMLKARNVDSLPVMISAGCSTARCAPLPPYEGYVDIHRQVHKGTNNGEVFTSPPPPPFAYQPHARGAISLGEGVVTAGDGGAVAYIGCNTGGQPCALTLLQGFATGLGKGTEPRLGDAWIAAVRHYYEKEHLATLKPNSDWYPPSIFFQAMKYMLFGDPSLTMPGPQ